jgi:PRC-barrel domain
VTYRLLSESPTGGTLPAGVPDVRGWPVRDDTGAPLGAVVDAVFDETAQTRFLVVELRAPAGNEPSAGRRTGAARRVLLPIGLARVGAPAGEVSVPGVSAGDLRRYPEFRGDAAAAVAALEQRAGNGLVEALTNPNALGATRSSDPDVGAEHPAGEGPHDEVRTG